MPAVVGGFAKLDPHHVEPRGHDDELTEPVSCADQPAADPGDDPGGDPGESFRQRQPRRDGDRNQQRDLDVERSGDG